MSSSYLLLTLTALFWAGNFVVGRAMRGALPPVGLAFWRWAIALCVILPFTYRRVARERDTLRRHWRMVMLLGVLGVGMFNTLVYVGLRSTSATNALLLNSTTPVFIVLIGWLFMGQRRSWVQGTGIMLSLMGVAAIVLKGDWQGLLAVRFNTGDLWIFAAVGVWSTYTVLLRKRPRDLDPAVFLLVSIMVGVLVILPFYVAETIVAGFPHLTPASMLALMYVGVCPSVVAYLFWNRAVAEVGAARAGMFIHLMPVFGTLLAMVFLGEALHGYHATGILLILAGIVLVTRGGQPASRGSL